MTDTKKHTPDPVMDTLAIKQALDKLYRTLARQKAAQTATQAQIDLFEKILTDQS